MKKILFLLFLMCSVEAFGQIGAAGNVPIGFGANLPATCSATAKNQALFYKTGTAAGLYRCTATNTWKKLDEVGSSQPTTDVTGTSQQMTSNAKYYSNNASRVTLTLPATCTIGDTIAVIGFGAGGWRVAQNANQVIHGNSDTTVGTSGYIESQARYDTVFLDCHDPLNWVVRSNKGTLTIN